MKMNKISAFVKGCYRSAVEGVRSFINNVRSSAQVARFAGVYVKSFVCCALFGSTMALATDPTYDFSGVTTALAALAVAAIAAGALAVASGLGMGAIRFGGRWVWGIFKIFTK